MRRWAYLVVDPEPGKNSARDREALLNRHGEQGWELVAAVVSGSGAPRFYFKRPEFTHDPGMSEVY